jgi:hypothetical protein
MDGNGPFFVTAPKRSPCRSGAALFCISLQNAGYQKKHEHRHIANFTTLRKFVLLLAFLHFSAYNKEYGSLNIFSATAKSSDDQPSLNLWPKQR